MFERRGLGVAKTLGGMGVIEGELDPEATGLLREALELAAPPDPEHAPEPPRTLRQRRADGLADICREYISEHADRDDGPRVAANLDVTMDFETLAVGFGSVDLRDARAVRCELARVGTIPLVTAQRLACDCAVGRVVMAGDSEVLDLGRRVRLVSPAIRRAVERRDRGACGRGATGPRGGATCTTSSPGNAAAPPVSRTARCCAGVTTCRSTKADGPCCATSTAPTK